jgi:hypothetical protein
MDSLFSLQIAGFTGSIVKPTTRSNHVQEVEKD